MNPDLEDGKIHRLHRFKRLETKPCTTAPQCCDQLGRHSRHTTSSSYVTDPRDPEPSSRQVLQACNGFLLRRVNHMALDATKSNMRGKTCPRRSSILQKYHRFRYCCVRVRPSRAKRIDETISGLHNQAERFFALGRSTIKLKKLLKKQ